MTKRNPRAALLLLLALGAGGCGPETSNMAFGVKDSFEEFARQSYDPSVDAYLVEGDLPFFTKEDLRAYYDSEMRQPSTRDSVDGLMSRSDPLIVRRTNNQDDRWDESQQHKIQYCVSTSFGENHKAVVEAMSAAAGDWEGAADVKFIYLNSLDGDCAPKAEDAGQKDKVLFYVQPNSSLKFKINFKAKAFFPSSPPSERLLHINWEGANEDKRKGLTGVLRHELGHILGFRHEHAHPSESNKCAIHEKDNDLRVLGDDGTVDRFSAMYYTDCGDNQNWDYSLSAMDRIRAAGLYGSKKG